MLGPSGALLVRTFGPLGALIMLVVALVAWVLFTWVSVHVVARVKEG